MDGSPRNGKPLVALVLPGGGARGAYEAGALSVLLPALEARGERVSIVCGTSVGAINAAMFASVADRPAAEIVDALLDRWRSMRKGDVIRPILGPGLPLLAARAVLEAAGVPGVRLSALLDATPLRASLDRWVDWVALQRNVRKGEIHALCVVATSLRRSGPVAFVQGKAPLPAQRPGADLHYVRVQAISGEHVRASAAIPLLFPPVEVKTPRSAWDYYVDGGTRLNTPLAPALALGAQRLIVLGVEPLDRRPVRDAGGPPPPPRLSDAAANILDGLLVDQVTDDLHRLAIVNTFLVDDSANGPAPAARAYRAARGRPSYRRVPYALVAPRRRGEIGRIAEKVRRERFGGLKGLRAPDYPLLARLVGGGPATGELLSFLLFDPEFVEALIATGAADARRWLARHPAFWCADATHDFPVDSLSVANHREQISLDEWRDLRRRL